MAVAEYHAIARRPETQSRSDTMFALALRPSWPATPLALGTVSQLRDAAADPVVSVGDPVQVYIDTEDEGEVWAVGGKSWELSSRWIGARVLEDADDFGFV